MALRPHFLHRSCDRKLRSASRVQSIRVVYESDDYDRERFPPGTYLHRIIVAKSPHCFFHDSSHGHDTLDWRDDLYQQRAYLVGDHLYNEFPVQREYFKQRIKLSDGLPGSLPQIPFFINRTLGIDGNTSPPSRRSTIHVERGCRE